MTVSAESTFDGIDSPDAKVSDKSPKLPAMGEFVLDVVDMEIFNGNDVGRTLGIDHVVVESNRPDVTVGMLYRTQITTLDHHNEKTRNLKLGKARQFFAAMAGVEDPDSKEFMAKAKEVSVMFVAAAKAGKLKAAPRRVRCKTGPKSTSKGGYEFTPVSFSVYKP